MSWFATPLDALAVLAAGSASSYSAIKAIISGEAPPTKLNHQIEKTVAAVPVSTVAAVPASTVKAGPKTFKVVKTTNTPSKKVTVGTPGAAGKTPKPPRPTPPRRANLHTPPRAKTTTPRRTKTTTRKKEAVVQLSADAYVIEGFTDEKKGHYLVKWTGYDEQTWESVAHLKSQLLADEFADCLAYLASAKAGTDNT